MLEYMELSNYSRGTVGASVISCSILDLIYMRAKRIKVEDVREYLYIVFDTKGYKIGGQYVNAKEGTARFLRFLKFSRANSHYIDDYWTGKGEHCIVFKVHKNYTNAYRNFLISQYSKMYEKEDLSQLGFPATFKLKGKERKNVPYLVLTKNEDAKVVLKKAIYNAYGVEHLPENPVEYDIPWSADEEILNYEYATKKEVEDIQQLKRKEYG
jgi:hypothetical protein